VARRLIYDDAVQGYDRVRLGRPTDRHRPEGMSPPPGRHPSCGEDGDPSTYALFAYFLFTATRSNPICDVRTTATAAVQHARCGRNRSAHSFCVIYCVSGPNLDQRSAALLPQSFHASIVDVYGGTPEEPAVRLLTAVMAFSMFFLPSSRLSQSVPCRSRHSPPVAARLRETGWSKK